MGRIPAKVKGLPFSLSFTKVCVHNSEKASIEQLWNPRDLREADNVHWLFFRGISVLKHTVLKTSHNHVIIALFYRQLRMVK